MTRANVGCWPVAADLGCLASVISLRLFFASATFCLQQLIPTVSLFLIFSQKGVRGVSLPSSTLHRGTIPLRVVEPLAGLL